MQVGDAIEASAVSHLPEGAVVVLDPEPMRGEMNTLVRVPEGLRWVGQNHGSSSVTLHERLHYSGDGARQWRVAYLPPAPLKVGDVIATPAQAEALPLGTVAVDDDEVIQATTAPIIKVKKNRWLYWDSFNGRSRKADDQMATGHRILHIPGADS